MVCSRSQCNNEKGSYLENVPAYTRNTTTDYYNELLNELNQRNIYKRQGRPPYLLSMIRCALYLRYMSIQAYRLLVEISPMPFSSLLNNIQQCGVDALKALKTLKRPLFSGLYFDDRSNVFAKICTVSIRRKCRGRKFVQRNFCVSDSWIKTVYTLSLFKPFQKSHLTDSGWPRKLVITSTVS